MTDLHVTAIGSGPRVVLVHGSMSNALGAFAPQQVLASELRLEFVDRRGFGASPPRPTGVDFDRDADDIAELLRDGLDGAGGARAHLVGHSYGAVVSLVVAGRAPKLLRSPTVIEPPAFGLARGDEAADRTEARMRRLFPAPAGVAPSAWYASFLRGLGFDVPDGVPVDGKDLPDIESSMTERFPGEAQPDLEAIRAANLPVLVFRGDWSSAGVEAQHFGGSAFAAICRRVVARTGARQVVVPGAAHNPQLTRAEQFNAELLSFVREVEARSSGSVAAGSVG